MAASASTETILELKQEMEVVGDNAASLPLKLPPVQLSSGLNPSQSKTEVEEPPHPAPAATANALLTPHEMGAFKLRHRVALAPLTRQRALGGVPQPSAVEYYSQRSSGGLMVTEATNISDAGNGYVHSPGIYTEEQMEGWKPIVKAVHEKGSALFLQLFHTGRASHADFQPDGKGPMSSTSKGIQSGSTTTFKGPREYKDSPAPRALSVEEIPAIVDLFRVAARNAIATGFDGVEIHGANGYLIDQFLRDSANDRTDEYGGSVENRSRFCLEVVKAVADEIGPDRVGLRLSPYTDRLDLSDSNPNVLCKYLVPKVSDLDILYLHMVEPRIDGVTLGTVDVDANKKSLKPFRRLFKGTFIASGGYGREDGNKAIEDGHADLIAFGRTFIANPDLPRRFELDAPLNPWRREYFYSQEQTLGYTDYPFLEQLEEKVAPAAA